MGEAIEQIPFLGELAIIALVGVVAAVLLSRLRVPAAAGLLAAGAVVGPSGLGLVGNTGHIEVLAEVGVVLLLFTIGLEFSLQRLRHIAKQVVLGGSLQVGLTAGAVVGVAVALGEPLSRALLYGFVFSLSSTAIVLKGLSERGEIDAPHGRITVGALLFQDLCVIPMVLILPVLAGREGGSVAAVLLALGKAAALVAVSAVIGRMLVPRLFAWVDRTRSREIFLLAVLGVCIGTAWLTSLVGLSLALGAFLAGLVLADTDYAHRALADVLPLRDAFTSLFFVSLGMLFDVQVLLEHPVTVLLLLVGLVLGKGFIATLSALAMRFPARVAWLAGVSLAQFSEFGFVLAKLGESLGLLGSGETRALLAAGVLSMFLTPVVMWIAPRFTAGERLLRPLERLLGVRGIDEPAPEHSALRDHVVVVGYGIAGRLLARALSESAMPYLVLELNAETVRQARSAGEPVYYGDVTSPEALVHAGVQQARALVLMINDPQAARRAVAAAKRFAPQTPILVRTRYIADGPSLLQLGVAEAVVEELEAGMEMMARVLRRVGLPRNLIADQIRAAREITQESQRKLTFPRPRLTEMKELADLKIESYLVRESAFASGQTALGLNLRSRTGALVVAIRREGVLLEEPDPAEVLCAGDTLFLVGQGQAIRAAIELLERGLEPASGEDGHAS